MDKIYTDLTLIKYLYNETDLFETLEIQNSLATCQAIRRQYKALVSAKKAINQSKPKPSTSSLQFILDYSRAKDWHSLI
jgi:hypothetical protein